MGATTGEAGMTSSFPTSEALVPIRPLCANEAPAVRRVICRGKGISRHRAATHAAASCRPYRALQRYVSCIHRPRSQCGKQSRQKGLVGVSRCPETTVTVERARARRTTGSRFAGKPCQSSFVHCCCWPRWEQCSQPLPKKPPQGHSKGSSIRQRRITTS